MSGLPPYAYVPLEATNASIRVAALPNAPLAPWIRPLCFFSAHPLKNAARSMGRS
jgi:hypothetical protein